MRTRLRTPLVAVLLPLVLMAGQAATRCGPRRPSRTAIASTRKRTTGRRSRSTSGRSLSSRTSPRRTSTSRARNQSLYRPGKEGDENKQRLDQAIEHYEKSLEINKANTPNLQQLRINTLGALTAMYSDPPLTNYEKALGFAEQLVKDNPNDAKNLYAMANLYEKFGRVPEAEQTYVKVTEQNPNDAKACGALAAFYNKPLWDEAGAVFVENQSKGARRAKFSSAIATLEKCAKLDATDPSGYYKLAMFYWDKAYRDPLIADKEKDEYADKGIGAVDTALGMKPDYWEAIITKGLLYPREGPGHPRPEAAQGLPGQGRAAAEAGDRPAQGNPARRRPERRPAPTCRPRRPPPPRPRRSRRAPGGPRDPQGPAGSGSRVASSLVVDPLSCCVAESRSELAPTQRWRPDLAANGTSAGAASRADGHSETDGAECEHGGTTKPTDLGTGYRGGIPPPRAPRG